MKKACCHAQSLVATWYIHSCGMKGIPEALVHPPSPDRACGARLSTGHHHLGCLPSESACKGRGQLAEEIILDTQTVLAVLGFYLGSLNSVHGESSWVERSQNATGLGKDRQELDAVTQRRG